MSVGYEVKKCRLYNWVWTIGSHLTNEGQMIEWKTRARVVRKSYGVHRILESRCGCHRVVHSKITIGDGYSDRYFAIRVCGRVERLISRHRKLEAAKRACVRDARKKGVGYAI